MKLQQAYVAESNAIGGWTLIGYTAPGASGVTTNFTYTGAVTANETVTVETADAFKAASNVDLNDCKAASAWAVKVTPGVGGAVTFTSTIAAASGSGTGSCDALTPTFTKIK